MLASLAIRDVVLIEKLDLSFDAGLAVLTGETGAGKSILLDSLGLALGQRAEAGLVRAGQAQASVAAAFLPSADHPCFDILRDQGISAEDELVLRRVLQADGKSRAFINDQPVSVALLKRLGATLVEVQGQHEQVGLADPTTHAGLLDAFGALDAERAATAAAWAAWRDATRRLAAAREAIASAQREEEWLRHAVGELADLAPEEGEEDALAAAGVVALLWLRPLILLRPVMRYLERLATHEATFRALADMRVWFFGRLAQRLPTGLGLRRAGDLLGRLVADVEALDGLYLRALVPAAASIAVVAAIALILGAAEPWLAVWVALPLTAALLLPLLLEWFRILPMHFTALFSRAPNRVRTAT